MRVASVRVDIFIGVEALLLAVFSSSKRQYCRISFHFDFEKVANKRSWLQILIKEGANLITVKTFPFITTRDSPIKVIKELIFFASTRIGMDLLNRATALLSLL